MLFSLLLSLLEQCYFSAFNFPFLAQGTKELLVNLSNKQGMHMSSPESAKEIPKFIEFFQDRINVDEFKYPVESYKTFNDFFIRELKPGARQIHCEHSNHFAVCAADCRLTVYKSADEAKRFWIKGRKFSVKGLLGDEALADQFEGGSLAIFRLAPQDYHRFHIPVSGIIGENIMIPGHLYTVNPIAVNSKYCNVFTDNKRVVNVITSKEFGKVAFVAIGATMVGSINFTKSEGAKVKKGEEFGYFAFGGSTVICVFQKGAIDFDEDLIANSERSLETLVFMGMSLGVSNQISVEEMASTPRPTVRNSVMALDNDIARIGVRASSSFNARQFDFIEDGDLEDS
ncbi:hypothetical protein KP509_26G017000 [Ceratopteris richardii]|uniref:phosphatidylserine decarboxylase n=1 Tax=Ceratopteris richardii TaxID=49495 RepID=A0A8T2RL17_CERRI|nr:hypothetical protein KP509_26G017000 [Ceratopteris richardii]